MRNSTAQRSVNRDVDAFAFNEQSAGSSQSIGIPNSNKVLAPSTALAVPEFTTDRAEMAMAAKIAGRRSAASIPESERRDLLNERQKLLDKLLDNNISRKEKVRLEYVRWSLDRIEDARHGESLDTLEALVSMYEQFASDTADFKSDIDRHASGANVR